MAHDASALKSRAVFTSTSLALASIGTALSTLLIPSLAIKIIFLVIAALLLVVTGASLSIVIARTKPPRDE